MKRTILEEIYASTLKFLDPLNPEETYGIVVEEAVGLIGGYYGSIILKQGEELKRVFSSSPLALKTIPRKSGYTYRAFAKQTTIIADISETAHIHPELKTFGVKWTIFIPLCYQRKSVGVLTINSKNNKKPNKKEIKALELFGSMASLAIRKTQLYDEAQKALESRNLFISMAGHELRTPITTIYGYAQLLYQRTRGINSLESRWIDALHTESYRLTVLVQDLLEINRIRSGRLQFFLRECRLKEIIERAIDSFKFNYPHREVIFDNHIKSKNDFIIADFDRVLQAFTNLLDNAAKFSPPTAPVTFILKMRSPYFIIQIKDQGRGIAKKDLARVFDEFYQGVERYPEGLGLGLYLVKNIVETHHGSVHLHSRLHKGTTVEIRLPRVKV
ncbi:MAG: hypothetical protein C4584_00410 [Armatimonadetes bacterium]|nr:MAG: hypothetical protein C4584_00410 [Armatimonadota bacterium]